MKSLITNALIYDTPAQRFVRGEMLCGDGRILNIIPEGQPCPDGVDVTVDARGGYLVPGLVDIHTHGRAGADFCTADGDALRRMKLSYLECGVTTVVPTLASATLDDWYRAAENIAAQRGSATADIGARLIGTHLEGRYLSPQKRGVQAAELLSPPDADELRMLVSRMGLPLHVSYAPELDPDGRFAAAAAELGVTLSAGHTAMDYKTAVEAERRGVRAYTHLFNAMPPLHHRAGGPVCAALTGEAMCELICDGHHIAPEMIRLVWRCAGNRRLVLISDSMEGAGAPDGQYQIAGVPVTVKDGVALSADGTLGGSTLDCFSGLKNLMRFCGVSLAETLPCATILPARVVGIENDVGSLEPGKLADALICRDGDSGPRLERVILGGHVAVTRG